MYTQKTYKHTLTHKQTLAHKHTKKHKHTCTHTETHLHANLHTRTHTFAHTHLDHLHVDNVNVADIAVDLGLALPVHHQGRLLELLLEDSVISCLFYFQLLLGSSSLAPLGLQPVLVLVCQVVPPLFRV